LDCVLHIGSAKTGTSSLQEMLFENRQDLASKGWLYPTTGLWLGDRSHNMLGIYFWDNFIEYLKTRSFDATLENFFSEVAGWNNIIVSSELIEKTIMHGNGNVEIFLRRLSERGYRIKVIYVVRRQDLFLDSLFKQDVSDFPECYAGEVGTYIQRHAPALTYARTASAWQARPEVDSVIVLPFREGRVQQTFVDVLNGMGRQDLVAAGLTAPMINPSLDGIYLRLKHYLNQMDMPSALHQRFFAASTVRSDGSDRTEKLTLFSPEDRAAFLHRFQDDHAQLQSEYGVAASEWTTHGNLDGPVFTPLAATDVAPALDRLRHIDPALADDVAKHLREKHWPS
jgi:hypothetical protein